MTHLQRATLHHMISSALLTVCEDAIHREWIGSAVYHYEIRDAPINTQDVQTSLFIYLFNCIILQHPASYVTAALFVFAHIQVCVSLTAGINQHMIVFFIILDFGNDFWGAF